MDEKVYLDRMASVLKRIGLGSNDTERLEWAKSLPKEARLILLFNSAFSHWREILENIDEDGSYEPARRAGMSDTRTLWYLISNLHVATIHLKQSVSAGMLYEFVPPLKESVVRQKISLAISKGLIKQVEDPHHRSIKNVFVTRKGELALKKMASTLEEIHSISIST